MKRPRRLLWLKSGLFPPVDNPPPSPALRPIIIAVCLQLTIHCAVSFRSVPKILAVFQQVLRVFGVTDTIHIPHFTTVIRWSLRVGIFLLNRAVTQHLGPWICIIDHTIQVGTKKAFVVLRVPITVLKKPGALTLQDVDVLSITVRETWNGSGVKEVLHTLFSHIGSPLQVVVDGGPDLRKGLRLLLQSSGYSFKVTADITHLIANLLKRKYQHHATFTSLLKQMAQTKQTILQTSLAYLVPLKERSKARFLNLPSIAKWTKQLLEYLNALPPLPNPPEEPQTHERQHQQQIRSQFLWLCDYQAFLSEFWDEIQILSDLQHLLKTTEFTDSTLDKAFTFVKRLSDEEIQKTLLRYLTNEYEWAQQTSSSILLTSDSIESLFGKYKYLAKPHSLSEINRMIFTLPCICHDLTPELISEAFSSLRQAEADQRIQQDISETLLSKRRNVFSSQGREKSLHPPVLPSSSVKTIEDSIALEYHGPKTAGTPLNLTG